MGGPFEGRHATEVQYLVMFYSAGPCSVCGVLGDALFVKNPQSGQLFFFCPSCGVAWSQPPKPNIVDSIDPVESFSPSGIVMPTREEIRIFGKGAKERVIPLASRLRPALEAWWAEGDETPWLFPEGRE